MAKFGKGKSAYDGMVDDATGHSRLGKLTFVFRDCVGKITENGNVEVTFPVTFDNSIPLAIADMMRGNDYSEHEIVEVVEAFNEVTDRSILRFHTVEKYRGG